MTSCDRDCLHCNFVNDEQCPEEKRLNTIEKFEAILQKSKGSKVNMVEFIYIAVKIQLFRVVLLHLEQML